MENENVIGKVCFAILRKGFVAGLRISLELDSPGCIIGCKFDGAGIVGNTVIDDRAMGSKPKKATLPGIDPFSTLGWVPL